MDNKKIYLDKIVQYMVDDTEIDYNNKSVNLLFLHPPMLLYFFPYPLPSPILEYCKDVYGLNDDETNYVLREYKNIIVDKINNSGSINESVDSKKIYLDKIVQYIIDDTVIDYEEGEIKYPYYSNILLINNGRLPFSVHSFRAFSIYCNDMYGLGIEEIQYVWKEYKNKLIGGEYINESMDRRDEYLNKIVDFLVDDTIIDYDKKMIRYPSPDPSVSFLLLTFHNRPSPFTFIPTLRPHTCSFSKFIKGNYGLTNDEIDYVWEEYKNIINEKIENVGSINESVDKISKGEYINKIVDYLVDDTMVDQKNKVWYPPFPTDHAKPTFNHFYGLIPMTDHLELKFLIGNSYVRNFFNYCKDTYGLTDDEEIRKLWKRYLKVLTPIIDGYSIINGIPTMNESVDRKNDYLNKVVEYLIDDTIIDIKGNRMRYPFLPPPEGNDPHSLAFLSTPYPFPFFSKYCKDNYGLTDEEIDYLLEKYIEILKYKIENMGSINESVDRKQDYLDKIVDFLMDDTEVGAGWFNPPYYIGNGRSTAGRTGFKSVYLHTFNLSSNTNYSGLDTQLIYFDHYCKNNYGLTGQENKIVWERYMTKLYESYDWGF